MKTIESLTIDDLAFDGSNFILQEVKGLELPTIRLPRYNLPGASGAFVSNALYGERAIRIRGVLNAPDGLRVTYLSNRTLLINNLSFLYDSNNRPTPRTLTIALANGQILTTQVYVDTPLAMGFSADQVDFEEFEIGLIAPDPLLYSSSPISGMVNVPIGGGAVIPTAIPISLAPSSGGILMLNNIGSQTTYPTITLNPPLTNPYITNQTIGQFISLNYTIAVGANPVVINCQTQRITQGINDITGIQSPDSVFWAIISGINQIGFSAAAGNGIAVITFSPAFLGI